MKPLRKGYLFDKMELTTEKYGKVTTSLIPNVSDDEEDLSLRASGPFGTMFLEETKCEDFNIFYNTYKMREETELHTIVDEPSLGLHFTLKNNFRYSIDGLPDGIIMKHQYNMIYLPSMDYKAFFKKSEECVTFSIHFTTSYLERKMEPFPLLEQFLANIRGQVPMLLNQTHLCATPEMMVVIHSMLHCTFAGKVRKMYLQAKVLELLMLALHHIDPFLVKLSLRHNDVQRVLDARDMLVENLENPCSLSELAHRVGINVFKLKNGFRQVYGTTVYGLLTEERMQKARRMLQDTDMFINEISQATGYKNLSNFTAAFKKRFGYPPSAVKTP